MVRRVKGPKSLPKVMHRSMAERSHPTLESMRIMRYLPQGRMLSQDWLPFLLAIGFVVAHHALLGTLHPHDVFNHPAAFANPFKWALVHGLFLSAASVASLAAWRLNEEQALHDSLTRLANRRLFRDRVDHALARV